jgi:hypothetical protein
MLLKGDVTVRASHKKVWDVLTDLRQVERRVQRGGK